MKMNKSMLPAGTSPEMANDLMKVYEAFGDVKMYEEKGIKDLPGVFKREETPEHKVLRHEVMKTTIRHERERIAKKREDALKKSTVTSGSGFDPYDLQAPSRHLVPWLAPIRESLPRVQRPGAGITAHWKAIVQQSGSYQRGGAQASPWVNEGQRAPTVALATIAVSQNYVTIGKDGSVTFEAESSSEGFEDALAAAHFFALETLMVSEEDSLLGGNKTLKLGTANTPTGTTTGSGSLTGTFYAKVIGLTYEGYRNYVLDNGLASDGTPTIPVSATVGVTPQKVIVTLDNKTMTVNTGVGNRSAASSSNSPSSSASATFTTVAKTGELAWAWYIGTSNTDASLTLVAVTTVPSYTFTATPATTGQALSNVASGDFSVNDGTTGGGANQVTAYDGIITQILNNTTLSPSIAYVKQMAGVTLSTSGRGNVDQIDTMLLQMWNLYKVTVDEIWVNAQEMQNITNRVLNTTSAPLLRYEREAGDDNYTLTASGVISYYYNPFIPGGKKIPIMIHPTIPPGTIIAYAKTLPSYFKSNSTPEVAQVLTRRDYYGLEYATTTREYQFGTYSENAGPAIYAPFAFGIISGIGNG